MISNVDDEDDVVIVGVIGDVGDVDDVGAIDNVDVQISNGIVVSYCRIVFPPPPPPPLPSSSTVDVVVKRFSIDLTSLDRFFPMPDDGELYLFDPFDVE